MKNLIYLVIQSINESIVIMLIMKKKIIKVILEVAKFAIGAILGLLGGSQL